MATTCSEGHSNADGSMFCNQCGKAIPAVSESSASEGGANPLAESLATSQVEGEARPRWKFYGIVAAVALLAIAIAVFGITAAANNAREQASEQAAADAARARLELFGVAVRECGLSYDVVQDDGNSAFLNNAGSEFGSGDLSITDVFCMLTALDTPDAVVNHMSQTRSLDGTQSDSWGEFSATWTYHPDNGLDIIIRLVQS